MIHSADTHPPRSAKRRQRAPRSAAKTVAMLDLLIEFFGDGEHWIKRRYGDRRGSHCLVGAMRYLHSRYNLARARTGVYLRRAMINLPGPPWWEHPHLEHYNDHRYVESGQVLALIRIARELAVADLQTDTTASQRAA
jgi:hypothetical protein